MESSLLQVRRRGGRKRALGVRAPIALPITVRMLAGRSTLPRTHWPTVAAFGCCVLVDVFTRACRAWRRTRRVSPAGGPRARRVRGQARPARDGGQ